MTEVEIGLGLPATDSLASARRLSAVAKESTMELLFTGGRVLTIDAMDRIATGVAVRDGRIIAVGDSDEAKQALGPDATHIDLRDAPLSPASAIRTITSR